MRPVVLVRLGRVPYGPVLELQRRLHSLRREGKIPDLLLSLEHEPVITLGRDGRNDHLLLPQDELRRMGVEIYAVERGGAATYHGPGQLVLYPVLDLRELGLGVREYVQQLEEVMIRTGKALGVELFRRPGYPGAWHRKGKVGFIGVYVRGWVTFHGLALNVDLRPNGFAWIVPCGAPGLPVVSLAELLPNGCTLSEVERLAHSAFSTVFGVELMESSPSEVWAWLSRIG
jgi:lipoate-protein ligase B